MEPRLTETPGLPLPGVLACYGHAWRQLWRRFWPLLGIGLVYFLLQTPNWVLGSSPPPADDRGGNIALQLLAVAAGLALTLISLAYSVLVIWPVSYGQAHVYLRTVRGETPRLGDLFAPFSGGFLSTIVSLLLLSLGGFLVLLVPALPAAVFIGVAVVISDLAVWVLAGLVVLGLALGAAALLTFLAVRFTFVPYLVVDEGLGPLAALTESWRRTGHHFWALLAAGLLSMLIILGGLLLFLVGVFPALMWVGLTHATLFASITAERAGAS